MRGRADDRPKAIIAVLTANSNDDEAAIIELASMQAADEYLPSTRPLKLHFSKLLCLVWTLYAVEMQLRLQCCQLCAHGCSMYVGPSMHWEMLRESNDCL